MKSSRDEINMTNQLNHVYPRFRRTICHTMQPVTVPTRSASCQLLKPNILLRCSMSDSSFRAKLWINGGALDCHVGFQYSKSGSVSGEWAHGSGGAHWSEPWSVELFDTQYLCANTCTGSKSATFDFEYVGEEGKYSIICADGPYKGYILDISPKGCVLPASDQQRCRKTLLFSLQR